jgi:hypothetical protein
MTNRSICRRDRLPALLAFAFLALHGPAAGAQPASAKIPDPPRQDDPWTPPATKLPRYIISAATKLFEQGIADPRGCEYRDVVVRDGATHKTRGFVLPQRDSDTSRFVVSWDGVLYRAESVGAPADLDQDVQTLAQEVRLARNSNPQNPNAGFVSVEPSNVTRRNGRTSTKMPVSVYHRTYSWSWQNGPVGLDTPATPQGKSALKLCLLIRLGRADLAETLFAAATRWTPENPDRDLVGLQVSYLSLAAEWASKVFYCLLNAHRLGDDAFALAAASRLTAFARAVDRSAVEQGFELLAATPGQEARSYLPFLQQLPLLLADQQRRAGEPARAPIPRRGGDPSARIAALIRDLDRIDVSMSIWSVVFSPGDTDLIRALIAEGDPAVEPLLNVVESDIRLTRSVTSARPGSINRLVLPVYEAAVSALEGILQTTEFRDLVVPASQGGLKARKDLAGAIRAFWVKNRGLSVAERNYRTLLDDRAGLQRWMDAARQIVEPIQVPWNTSGLSAAAVPRKSQPPKLQGEELRSKRDPSVSELLARRVTEIARAANPLQHPDIELHRACELALLSARWDRDGALPSARALMAQCRVDISLRRDRNVQPDEGLAGFVSRFAMIRAADGGRDGLGEYALWIRSTTPAELAHQSITCFEPMWTRPDDPAIAAAARSIWNDPDSPWLALLRSPTNRAASSFFDGSPYASPLLRVPSFRDAILAALSDTSLAGTVSRTGRGAFQFKMGDGTSGYATFKTDLDEVARGVDMAFRACDYIAWQVSFVEGSPEFELYWPEERRDRAIESCASFLKKYANRFTADTPDHETNAVPRKANLAFPPLRRPATGDDVRDARAVFSLEGQGEARLAKVPQFPIHAQWVTLKEFAFDRPRNDGTYVRDYGQDGWIWQAEELRTKAGWERYYGFVGQHKIARVPAAEIELLRELSVYVWGQLTGGLDARIEPVEPRESSYPAGQPIQLVLRFRNRRGVEQPAPIEFIRDGNPGGPALRCGVTIVVSDSRFAGGPNGQGQGGTAVELKPKRSDRFEPGDASRTLAAFEGFELARLDLTDWFDLTRPGPYSVRIKFAADSGVGTGTSNDWPFQVASPEALVP